MYSASCVKCLVLCFLLLIGGWTLLAIDTFFPHSLQELMRYYDVSDTASLSLLLVTSFLLSTR